MPYRDKASEIRESNWANLESTLRLGGRFQGDGTEFFAPYTWTVDLPESSDPFETYFVIGDRVALRDRPIQYGEIIARLSYDIVRLLEGGEGTPYREVELASGITGFVHNQYLRSSVDYRAIFVFDEGRWQMTVFIAGD